MEIYGHVPFRILVEVTRRGTQWYNALDLGPGRLQARIRDFQAL